MKKILSFVIVLVMSLHFAQADEVITKNVEKLPLKARNFINQHFTPLQISYIKIDDEFLKKKKFEVVMTNGVELEFDSNGEWREIDCKRNVVPVTIIPTYVANYVRVNFPDNKITKIERERPGIKIELDNGLDILFDKQGNMLKVED